jgi:decaprenylphospho-beta-D-erythro-pentofuranosid-2-ulose 2-reductase
MTANAQPGSAGTVLVLGGTSDIGRATAATFAAKGWSVQLAGRDLLALQREADDIATRTGASVAILRFDALDAAAFVSVIDGLGSLPDVVVCAVGVLGDQAQSETDLDHATWIMRSNYEGPSLILGLIANRFLARGHGTIVGISSVAGDRGRASNYAYGSAKAGFTAFLSGLRNRCAGKGVHVMTVKPGFVRTRMTAGLKLPGLLTAEPSEVAASIFAATTRRRNVVYVKPIWSLLMVVIGAIPEPLFKRMRI